MSTSPTKQISRCFPGDILTKSQFQDHTDPVYRTDFT